MKQTLTTFYLLFSLLLSGSIAVAAEELLIRSSASPESVWPGQKVTVSIDVLVADGWAQAKNFRDVEIESGYLLRYESQGTRLNESIDGKAYSGQRYELFFFAHHSGEQTIPELPLDIEVKSWATPAASGIKRKSTPAIPLSVKTLPNTGTATDIISTTRYRANQTWNPEGDSLQPGDAITRTISFEAADVAAMLFPPLSFPDIDGMGVYPGEPTVHDTYQRGELSGKRVETVSYVMEQPGTYELPAHEFYWWNVAAEKLEKITLPGLSLTVSGETAPSQDSAEVPAPEGKGGFPLLPLLVVFPLLAILLYYRNQIKKLYQQQLERARESENAYFRRIADGAHSNNPKTVVRATMQWLDRISETGQPPATLDQFLERYGDEEVRLAAGQLMNLTLPETAEGQIKLFYRGLRRCRTRWLSERQQRKKIDSLLPEIGLSGENRGG